MSLDKDGKMSWGVEVEPPEDLDKTDYDIHSNMKIWKSMTGGGKVQLQLKAEKGLDVLYHPSMAKLLKVQIQNADHLPAAENQAEYEKAEKDEDSASPPDFKVAPEEDLDAVYHKAREELAEYLAPLMAEYQTDAEVRPLYSEPEEDMDDVYHKDLLQLVPYQNDAVAVALADVPSQRKHSKPEEDLDDIYHQ
ncbi:uncharacterized protein si:ch211-217g15.3 isoform X2 [Cheilinus undulatus]|nr:uncharacterized protein si:ch211-217g15.3 isoform X2 [Cheilinus undulatus]XP_041645991.1 uncharacterized protein si:ch211-217g15.3 isoform X2 [Cheilinus undulatus]XP_041645992.1 uncharacterized protein si:ch211-217g15.3 isoform X2 [Cheilinus undulatus]